MKRVIQFAFVTVLAISSAASAGPVLLATYTQIMEGATAPQSDPRVEFLLQVAESVPVDYGHAPTLGEGNWWTNGTTGALERLTK